MKNIFGLDSPLFAFLSKVCDLVFINFLWMVTCLPVFTIGAATAAMYRCIFKLHKEGSVKIWRTYLEAFRQEFKQGTVLFFIQLLLILILAADINIMFFSEYSLGLTGHVAMCILTILIFPGMCYVFPLQSYFQNTIGHILKNAWLMAFSHLPVSLTVAVIHLVPIVLLLIWPTVFFNSLIIWLLIGGALIAYTSSLLLRTVFKRYE